MRTGSANLVERRSASAAPLEAPVRPDHDTGPEESGDERHVLLVVEDDPDDFLLLERAFRKAGACAILHWVQTGVEALASLPILEADAQAVCVVADVQLPRMDGFELLRQVKSRHSPARLRFAFLTGRRDSATREKANRCGADAFFTKPNGTQELVEIARAIARLANTPAE